MARPSTSCSPTEDPRSRKRTCARFRPRSSARRITGTTSGICGPSPKARSGDTGGPTRRHSVWPTPTHSAPPYTLVTSPHGTRIIDGAVMPTTPFPGMPYLLELDEKQG
jgi:hypothetical protein